MNFREEPFFVREDDPRETVPLYTGVLADMPSDAYDRLFDESSDCIPRAPVFCGPMFTASDAGIEDVLACVRDPENNTIHPHVVSAPTIRIEADRLSRIASEEKLGMTAVQHLFRVDSRAWRHNHSEGKVPDTETIIDRLLKVKFGIARAALSYQYVVHSLTLGDSRVGVTEDWRDIIEKVAMLNAPILISKEDMHKISPRTGHYSDIRWVSWGSYKEMQDKKYLLDVYKDEAAKYCLHGVCNVTSRVALDDIHDLLSHGQLL